MTNFILWLILFLMKYKCVISDMDRTLLHSDGKISEYTKTTLEKLISGGIMFVPASGRALNSLPQDLYDINGIKYAITSNGVSVDDLIRKESLGSLNITPKAISDLFDFLKDEKIMYECFINGQGYTSKDYYENPMIFGGASYKTEYVRRTRIPVENIMAFMKENINKIQCVDVLLSSSDRERILESIRENIKELYVTSGENFLIEIMHKDCGKHRGMQRFCKMMEIRSEEIVAFGDGRNDMELLRDAGLGIAVANAAEITKNNADIVLCETNDEDAVAKQLEKLFP